MTQEVKKKLHHIGILILRVGAGLAMASHGFDKIFGGWMPKLTEGVAKMGFPFPAFFAWAAALSEFAGALLIVAGLAARAAAGFLFITMGVAFFVAHGADPFNVKELAFLYFIIFGAIIFTGAGKWSLDRFFKS